MISPYISSAKLHVYIASILFHLLQLLQNPQLLPTQKPAKKGGTLICCRSRRPCSPRWKDSMKWLDLLLTLTRALVWGLLVSLLCQSKRILSLSVSFTSFFVLSLPLPILPTFPLVIIYLTVILVITLYLLLLLNTDCYRLYKGMRVLLFISPSGYAYCSSMSSCVSVRSA